MDGQVIGKFGEKLSLTFHFKTKSIFLFFLFRCCLRRLTGEPSVVTEVKGCLKWQCMVEERSIVATREFHFPFPFASRSESCCDSLSVVVCCKWLFLEGKEIAKGKEERAVAGHAEILLDGSQIPSMLVVGKNKSSLYFGYLLSFFFLHRIFPIFCLLYVLSQLKTARSNNWEFNR